MKIIAGDGEFTDSKVVTITVENREPEELLEFSDLGTLNTNAGTDSGNDLYVRIATDGAGVWVAVWNSNDALGDTAGTDYDILVSRSLDDGVSWSAPAPLTSHAATDSAADMEPSVATDGAGNWIVVWYSNDELDGIGTDNDILASRSTDNGATWTDPVPVNTNAADDSGSDYTPHLVTDGAGTWIAAWQSQDTLGGTIGSDLDILLARSTDDGVSWTAPAPLNSRAAVDSGSDYQITIATDKAGTWTAAWMSWDYLGSPNIGTDDDILTARSTDNGATWSAQAPLNTNAETDSGHDTQPHIATDGHGVWYAVWQSQDTLGDTIGTDLDILGARSTDNGATWSAPVSINPVAGNDSGTDTCPPGGRRRQGFVGRDLVLERKPGRDDRNRLRHLPGRLHERGDFLVRGDPPEPERIHGRGGRLPALPGNGRKGPVPVRLELHGEPGRTHRHGQRPAVSYGNTQRAARTCPPPRFPGTEPKTYRSMRCSPGPARIPTRKTRSPSMSTSAPTRPLPGPRSPGGSPGHPTTPGPWTTTPPIIGR